MNYAQFGILAAAIALQVVIIIGDYRRHQRIIQHERQQQFARALDRAIADRKEGVK